MDDVRVLLADDDRLLCATMAAGLSECRGIRVVDVAYTGDQALRSIARRDIDVALLDVEMPGMDGIEVTACIGKEHPEIAVVILTAFARDDFLPRALYAGARGFITKDTPVDQIAAILQGVMQGNMTISPRPADLLRAEYGTIALRHHRDRDLERAVSTMPDHLRSVFELLAAAATNREIARRLHLSEATVKVYVSEILARTACESRTQLAVRTARSGIVPGT
ncbi:response regulator [Schaalia naturae]|jgi:DNA-binding NarL/FixJ family response regulator|uniref:Response regulator n=1 Tax=Schaalia naturae TaxID=635203 RepID=A0ABW2SIH9_9ACTO